MSTLKEDPHRAVILGAGRGGSAILDMLLDEDLVDVIGIVDKDPDAEGLALAKQHNVPVYSDVELALRQSAPCVAFNMTGNEMIEAVAAEIIGAGGVVGGMEASLMWRMVTNLKKAKDELHFQASHDALTGLHNRRHMMEQMQQGISQALRYKHAYTIAMLDLDHFKQVNDVHGHAAGDQVLMKMANILQTSVRDADSAGRWGGEEFIVLLPHTSLNGAKKAAEQWLKYISAAPIKLDNGKVVHISFSGGVATLDPTAKNRNIESHIEHLLHLADERMYAAKARGRSRVCSDAEAIASPPSLQTNS